jgi:hypothetical protein
VTPNQRTRRPRQPSLGGGAALIGIVGLLFAASAGAHRNAPAWTEARVERAVLRDATVLLPEPQRTALQRELLVLIPRFRILENLVWDEGDTGLAGRVHNYRYRYSTALGKVERGLRVTAADCRGTGKAVEDARFRHFDCKVISEQLEIATVEIVYPDEGLPAVVESEPRRFGPYDARLRVHVVGVVGIASRQVGTATPL